MYEEIEDKGQRIISTHWICTLKETPQGIIPKTRLVARGLEEYNKDDLAKDSPTCGAEALKLILAIIVQNRWRLASMDIKTAFLQGYTLSRAVYLRPPKEAQKHGIIWKLNKCVYGLTDV